MSVTPEQKLILLHGQLEALDHLLHAVLSLLEQPKDSPEENG